MIRRKTLVGMAAAAAILVGMSACHKAASEESAEAAETAQGPEAAETVEIVDVDAPEVEAPQVDASEIADAEEVAPATKVSDYTVTPSGLKYRVIRKGTGKTPKATDMVTVNYRGTLTNGTQFDSSYDRGEPATFPLNRVIAGWTEGLQLMQEGAQYEFYIPSNLAYGPAGAGNMIPPNADLIFTVELLKVE